MRKCEWFTNERIEWDSETGKKNKIVQTIEKEWTNDEEKSYDWIDGW